MEPFSVDEPLNVNKSENIKIVLLGKGVVGKSSLTYRFINYNAPKEHDATIEDRYKSTAMIEGENREIEILDTAGEEDYQKMLDAWINFGDGFLLVFAINDEDSFKALPKKRERIVKIKAGKACPILLIGNKQDLDSERVVEFSEAKKIADSWGIEYLESSAKTNFNCREIFEKLASKIIEAKKDEEMKREKCCCNVF